MRTVQSERWLAKASPCRPRILLCLLVTISPFFVYKHHIKVDKIPPEDPAMLAGTRFLFHPAK